jgi:hypothetical protein
MNACDELALRSRIETLLLVNVMAYLALGCAVFVSSLYETHQGGAVDLALSVDLLAIAAKGFLVGVGLLLVNDVWE